jgi:DNA polymerase-1
MDFSSCTACPLSEKVNHVGLPGTGNPESGLWIILDRPGYKEDNIGVSFSGTAGQFLASMLVKVGLTDENSYYLTYLTKCALPDVKDQEMKKVSTKTCFPTWLEKEIIEYKPRVIIALGNDVMSALSDQTGIIKNRGLIFDAEVGGHKFKMVPTLSPAYLLQDRRELEGQVEYDIKRAIAIYNGTDACWDDNRRNSLNYRTILTEGAFLEFYNEVKEAGIVAVDIESRGKDPYRQRTAEDNQFPLVSIQFSTKEGTAWFLPIAHETGYSEKHPDGQFWDMQEGNVVYDGLKDILSGDWCLVIGHNFKFDSKFILKCLGIKVKLGFDTMLAHGLFEETSNSLKKIAWELTDMGGYEKAQQEYTDSLPADEQWDMFFYPWDQLMMYGCADADVTLRIFKVFDERLRKEPQLLRVFKLLIDASMAFLDIENDGIRLDTDYLTKLGIELDIEANTLEGEFKKLAFKEIMQLEEELLEAATGKSGKVLKNKPTLFNISSNSHINNLFFEKMGIPPSEKYKSKKTGEYSVGKFFLKSIEEDYPVAAKLLKHRTVSKQKAGFVDAYPEFLDENGRIHPDYKLIKFFNEESNSEQGTVSGRLACSNPNLQQVPSRGDGKRIKKLFIPDHSDHWLVDADYKGIEMRVAAMYAQDSNMKKFFNEGEGDFHRWTASQITGKKPEDVTDAERTSAKSCSFGILYGAGPAKIAEQARMTEKQALKFIDQYFKLFPGLKKWINSQKKFAERNLYVRSIFGRIRHLPNAGSRNEALREAAFRRAINSPIQSDASDLTLHALTRIHKYLRNFKHFDVSKPSALRGSVHDSILLSVHDNDLTEILSVLKYKILESPDLDFIDSKGVKLGADIAIGKNWGEKETVEL